MGGVRGSPATMHVMVPMGFRCQGPPTRKPWSGRSPSMLCPVACDRRTERLALDGVRDSPALSWPCVLWYLWGSVVLARLSRRPWSVRSPFMPWHQWSPVARIRRTGHLALDGAREPPALSWPCILWRTWPRRQESSYGTIGARLSGPAARGHLGLGTEVSGPSCYSPRVPLFGPSAPG